MIMATHLWWECSFTIDELINIHFMVIIRLPPSACSWSVIIDHCLFITVRSSSCLWFAYSWPSSCSSPLVHPLTHDHPLMIFLLYHCQTQQITGWGLIDPAYYDKNNFKINDPPLSRQLKVGYVRDHSLVCDNQSIQICVFNGTTRKTAKNETIKFDDLGEFDENFKRVLSKMTLSF